MRWSELQREVRALAADVPPGTTSKDHLCPACGGGSSGEKAFSLTVTDDGDALYLCHRASCGIRGCVGAVRSNPVVQRPHLDSRAKEARTVSRVFRDPVRPLGGYWLPRLRELYGFHPDDAHRFGWGECVRTGGLVLRVWGPSGLERGIELRGVPGTGYPKSRSYPAHDGPWMGWFSPEGRGASARSHVVVLVEDLLSAAKVATAGFTAASLMGTTLGADKAQEILALGLSPVLALDRDAFGRALDVQREFRGTLGNFPVLFLSKDLKYENKETIKEMIAETQDNS